LPIPPKEESPSLSGFSGIIPFRGFAIFKVSPAVLIPVPNLESFETEVLPFDLYDGKGHLILQAGEPVYALKKLTLPSKAYYRFSLQDSVCHEGVMYAFEPHEPSLEELEMPQRQLQPISYGEFAPKVYKALAYFWEDLQAGKAADEALLRVLGEELVSEVTSRLEEVQYLSQLRVRDPYTYDHTLDVATMSIALASQMGLSSQEVKEVALGALLHDLGKLQIPESIMFKVGRLTDREFEVMKLHPTIGHRILSKELRLPDPVCRPALEHQEMYGGGGYPQNLRGNEIHDYSHIVKIADVYDALTSKRPYKEPIPNAKALQIMKAEGARGFHPELLETFCQLCNGTRH
jgi:putative nucleotidyltransferase with HDIG domain